MRTDDRVDFTGGDRLMQAFLISGLERAGQEFDPIRRLRQHPLDVASVLFGEDLSRRHQRALIAILHCGQHGYERDDRLAAAHVALQQTVHWRVGLQVAEDLFDDATLRVGELERQDGTDPPLHSVIDLDCGTLLLPDAAAVARRQRQRKPKHFVEDEPAMRRAARVGVVA